MRCMAIVIWIAWPVINVSFQLTLNADLGL